MRGMVAFAALASLGVAAPIAAQGRGNGGIPPGQRPPAGLCRVWIDGVPPGRQPRPTTCARAEASVPRNGRVIWGDHTASQRVYNSGVYDRRVYDPRVYDSRRYDPRVRTSNVSVVSIDGRACTRQIVNGAARIDCPRRNEDKDKYLKHEKYEKYERKHDGDRDDHRWRPEDRARDDRDRSGHR